MSSRSTPGGDHGSLTLSHNDNLLPQSKPVPRWVPVSLLALTTAALVVPIVLLRRHKNTTLTRSLHDAPPPPRRTSTVGGSTPVAPLPRAAPSPSPQRSTAEVFWQKDRASPAPSQPVDSFNDALYGVKAFGYATLFVTAGAIASVWGVKTYMGVKDTQEFAERMRYLVQTKMPALSSRIHRPPTDDDHTGTIRNSPTGALDAPQIVMHEDTGDVEWTWPDAEKRLRAAYDNGGFSGWAQAALEELEAEGRSERRKRGHA